MFNALVAPNLFSHIHQPAYPFFTENSNSPHPFTAVDNFLACNITSALKGQLKCVLNMEFTVSLISSLIDCGKCRCWNWNISSKLNSENHSDLLCGPRGAKFCPEAEFMNVQFR